ncbi:MAG: 50S ribosomal protein L37e [Thermoplasmatota archaeon]
MTKGTSSKGKRQNPVHRQCRRCGRHSYHAQKKRCSSCGFGETAKLRRFAWNHKYVQRH